MTFDKYLESVLYLVANNYERKFNSTDLKEFLETDKKFEADLAHNSEFKRQMLKKAGINSSDVHFVVLDFEKKDCELIGVEAGGSAKSKLHAAPLSKNSKIGILHGAAAYCVQNSEGQIDETESCGCYATRRSWEHVRRRTIGVSSSVARHRTRARNWLFRQREN